MCAHCWCARRYPPLLASWFHWNLLAGTQESGRLTNVWDEYAFKLVLGSQKCFGHSNTSRHLYTLSAQNPSPPDEDTHIVAATLYLRCFPSQRLCPPQMMRPWQDQSRYGNIIVSAMLPPQCALVLPAPESLNYCTVYVKCYSIFGLVSEDCSSFHCPLFPIRCRVGHQISKKGCQLCCVAKIVMVMMTTIIVWNKESLQQDRTLIRNFPFSSIA